MKILHTESERLLAILEHHGIYIDCDEWGNIIVHDTDEETIRNIIHENAPYYDFSYSLEPYPDKPFVLRWCKAYTGEKADLPLSPISGEREMEFTSIESAEEAFDSILYSDKLELEADDEKGDVVLSVYNKVLKMDIISSGKFISMK